MTKKCFLAFIFLIAICGGFLTAQNDEVFPKLGITDSDVKSFVNNFDKIKESLENYNPGANFDDEKALADVEAILQKHGISGPNRVQKVSAITVGISYEAAVQEMNKELDAATVKQLQAMGFDPYDALKQLKERLHPDDMKVITRNAKLYDKLYEKLED